MSARWSSIDHVLSLTCLSLYRDHFRAPLDRPGPLRPSPARSGSVFGRPCGAGPDSPARLHAWPGPVPAATRPPPYLKEGGLCPLELARTICQGVALPLPRGLESHPLQLARYTRGAALPQSVFTPDCKGGRSSPPGPQLPGGPALPMCKGGGLLRLLPALNWRGIIQRVTLVIYPSYQCFSMIHRNAPISGSFFPSELMFIISVTHWHPSPGSGV